METLRHITIDLYKTEIIPILKCKQRDTGRNIGVKLVDNGAAFDMTGVSARIYAKKSDGTVIYNDAMSIVDNEVIFNITNQMSIFPGRLPIEIEIRKELTTISTPIALIDILPSNIDDSAIESTNEFTALDNLIDRAETLLSGDISDRTVSYSLPEDYQNMQSGDSIGLFFGKVDKVINGNQALEGPDITIIEEDNNGS